MHKILINLRLTFAILNDLYFLKAFAKMSVVTSFPKFPQKIRKSFSGHSSSDESFHTIPAAFLKCG